MTKPLNVDTWAAIEIMEALAPKPAPEPDWRPISEIDASVVLKDGLIGCGTGFTVLR